MRLWECSFCKWSASRKGSGKWTYANGRYKHLQQWHGWPFLHGQSFLSMANLLSGSPLLRPGLTIFWRWLLRNKPKAEQILSAKLHQQISGDEDCEQGKKERHRGPEHFKNLQSISRYFNIFTDKFDLPLCCGRLSRTYPLKFGHRRFGIEM